MVPCHRKEFNDIWVGDQTWKGMKLWLVTFFNVRADLGYLEAVGS
jgi:hypothetical protein